MTPKTMNVDNAVPAALVEALADACRLWNPHRDVDEILAENAERRRRRRAKDDAAIARADKKVEMARANLRRAMAAQRERGRARGVSRKKDEGVAP